MAEYSIWIKITCPIEFADPANQKPIRSIAGKTGTFCGGYKGRVHHYNYNTHKNTTTPIYTMVYEWRRNDRDFYGSWHDEEELRKKIHKYFEKHYPAFAKDNQYCVQQARGGKPKQIWTKEEKTNEKAQREAVKADNVVGRIFTTLGDNGFGHVYLILREVRGYYQILKLDVYAGAGEKIVSMDHDRISKKELIGHVVEVERERDEWKENDLGFLVVHGSPKELMTKKIQEYMDPYQRAVEALAQIKEDYDEVKVAAMKAIKEKQ